MEGNGREAKTKRMLRGDEGESEEENEGKGGTAGEAEGERKVCFIGFGGRTP